MKEQPTAPLNLLAKFAFLSVTLVAMLGCDPGGGLPGAPNALRSGIVPVAQEAEINVCAAVSNEPDGLPSEELGVVGTWELWWSDEFDGTAVNTSSGGVDTDSWSFQNGNGCPDLCGWGNGELEYYQESNATVANGMLTLVGKQETVGGNAYTSARIRTADKIDFTYGRVEARIQVPAGRGFWPAFWMLPTDSPYGTTWASTGEIDIFETFNPGVPAVAWSYNNILGTIHHGFSFPDNLSKGASYTADPTVFHDYAIEWEANEIRWYIDGVHYQTIGADYYRSYYWGGKNTGFVKAPPGAPYDVEFYILLNLAIGGGGPGQVPDASTEFPANMLVDYVRVYKCMIDGVESESGGGCANNVDPAIEKPPAADVFVADQILFDETANDIVFCSGSDAITREMRVDVLDNDPGVTASEMMATIDADEHGTVLDITIENRGGVAFVAEDGGTFTLLGMGEAFGNPGYADLRLDLYVDSANTDQSALLLIMMNNIDDDAFDVIRVSDLPQDQWTTISVRLSHFIAAGLDPSQVAELFGVFAIGSAHIQVDNVRLVCGSPLNNGCGIEPPATEDVFGDTLNVFIDEVDPIWTNNIGAWDTAFGADYFDGTAGRHVQWQFVETGEAGHDTVVEISFAADGADGVWFIQSGIGLDLTSFLEGKLIFDLRLIAGNNPPITYKVDCRFPCGTGDQSLAGEVTGDWQTFEVTVASLVAAGLDIEKVNTGIVIFPDIGSQQGVTFQLDNLRWEKVGGEPPPPPPPEGSQSPTLPAAGSLILYQDTTVPQWELWDCCGNAVLAEVAASDAEHGAEYGMVTQISYGEGGSVSGYSYGASADTETFLDASGFPGGTLEFDALIVSNPDSGAPWILKVTSPLEATAVEIPLTAGHGSVEKPEGEWAHYSFSLDNQLGSLDKSKMKLFMLFPIWENADGGVIQLDNVHIAPAPAP